MFQIELIVFLQSLGNEFITFFMIFITYLGYESFYIAISITILCGINFKKGFILIQIITWAGAINGILKHFFALPRPLHVDKNLLRFRGDYPEFKFINQGATSFWGFLDKHIIQHIRIYAQTNDLSYGFPSGHVMGATGFWGGNSLLFKKRLLYFLTPVMIILMSLSRMYLARHFLADVLGGIVFGLVVVFIFYLIFNRLDFQRSLFDKKNYAVKNNIPSILVFLYLIILPLILIPIHYEIGRIILGLNLGFYLIMLKGLPDSSGSILIRVGRVSIGFLVYILLEFTLKLFFIFTGIDDEYIIYKIISGFLPVFGAMFFTYLICLQTGLFKLEK